MRNVLFTIFILFNSWVNYAQISNRTCEAAEFICVHGPYSQSYDDSEQDPPCVGPTDPLYYVFNFTAAITNSIQIPESPTTGSYIFYGPFSGDMLDACEEIELNSAQAVYGNFGIGAGLQTLGNQIGFYILRVLPDQCSGAIKLTVTADAGFGCESETDCADCVTSFSPSAGKYMVSAWVKESGAPYSTINYSNSSLEIYFTGDPSTYSLVPSGQIIDGWQRIEGIIDIPGGATDLSIAFTVSSGVSYFDDIRFFPFDGSMMSYVYDPLSLRLMAELDERNYATLYEYDEEGKLIRVKKETERGIMTIQENRDNIVKQ